MTIEFLSDRLRRARKSARLTQEEASFEYEMNYGDPMPQSTLSELELGKRKLSAIELFRFCEIYNVDAEYFNPRSTDATDRIYQGMQLPSRLLASR